MLQQILVDKWIDNLIATQYLRDLADLVMFLVFVIPVIFIVVYREIISERLKLEADLHQSERMLRQLFESTNDNIILVDIKGLVKEINTVGLNLIGAKREEAIGKPYPRIFHPDDDPVVAQAMKTVLTGEPTVFECRSFNLNSEVRRFVVNAMPYYENKEIAGVFCLSRDVTEQNKQHETIRQLAYNDYLTGLPNRRFFNDEYVTALNKAVEQNGQVALLYLDLDRLKAINDNLGHATGDELLKQVSIRFRNVINERGFLARIGGDEFTVILDNYNSLTEVTEIVDEIIACLKEPILLNYLHIRASVSIGIAFFPEHGSDATTLFQVADTAMYQAKYYGGNQYRFYNPAFDTNSAEEFYLEHDLALAIQKQEFILEYQPKVDCETLYIRGVEALVRWNHPIKGVISPGKVIPIAEKTGLIAKLGEWVLRETCKQAKEWQENGFPPFRIAVNVSPVQIKHHDLASLVGKILNETGLDAKWLEIEITEGIFLEKHEIITQRLTQLKELGVYISLDDFGTGYSSMQYLKKFRVNGLKIDRAFINHVNEQPEQASITKAILQLGHGLGMHVLAEGVETEEELEFLRGIGVDEIQGYKISKPLSTIDFEIFMKKDLQLKDR